MSKQWIDVDGYKNLPNGEWLVRLDEEYFDTFVHVCMKRENCCFIGGHFAFDMANVVEYRSIPE